jgi:REP element-mobilizing transposase RayT
VPRRLWIEFEGAIYPVMARGNAWQRIVRDDADRRRLLDGLEQTVVRRRWELVSYVVMGNHLHLLVKTRRANLGAGMPSFLSSFAIWAGRRWRRLGHLFPGRYRAEMVEDESYYWTSSRYIHLNPARVRLVRRPEQWEWLSYPGYRDPRRAQAWVAHDALLEARQGERGGRDRRRDSVRFVESSLADPPPSPFREAFGGWIMGSERFVPRLWNLAGADRSNPPVPEARHLAGLDPKRIIAAQWRSFTGWRVRGCRGAAIRTWRDRSRPGCTAEKPRRRCGSSLTGWAFRAPIAYPIARVDSNGD